MAFIVGTLLASCTYAVSKKYVEEAVKDVSFSQVRQNPDLYLNDIFIFGGTVVRTKNTGEGTEIEIVENPIDKYGYIEDTDVSEGRLLLQTKNQLDPLIFKRGRLITFAGRLLGTREGKLGERQYTYLLFEAQQIHLWAEERYYPYSYPYPPYYGPLFYPNYYYFPGPPYWYPWWY